MKTNTATTWTNVRIKAEVHNIAKKFAEVKGMKLSSVIEFAISEYIHKANSVKK